MSGESFVSRPDKETFCRRVQIKVSEFRYALRSPVGGVEGRELKFCAANVPRTCASSSGESFCVAKRLKRTSW